MQKVLVVGTNRKPLMPCHPARARELLRNGKATVLCPYPFTIILKEREIGVCQPIEFKTDPGSKTTGIGLVVDCKKGKKVVWACEINHRGRQIKSDIASRRAIRRGRRNRNTRYRQPRFDNRTRLGGWLPPSLMSRVYNIETWASRLARYIPLSYIAVETVRFDTQKLQDPEISGVEYQQGNLLGYEVREYLFEKWGRKCVYCGKENVPLEIEHIIPGSRGGTDRVSNLTLSCKVCNKKKNNLTAEEFGFPDVQKQAQKPIKDAAAVNATRYAIGNALKGFGLPVTFWSGGRTKFNRTQQGYPKAHWIDAACVGETGEHVHIDRDIAPLIIMAKGHGNRQMCGTDKHGFPIKHRTRSKFFAGFQTGDMVRAVVPKGKYIGIYTGSVAIRASGYFDLKDISGKRIVQGVSYKFFKTIHRFDGYNYKRSGAFLTTMNCHASCASLS